MPRGRPRKPKLYTGKPPINENWSEYLIRAGSQALVDDPQSDRAVEFRKYANRITRQANKQLAALKKHGMTHFGYESVQAYTRRVYGTTRFKLIQGKMKLTPKQLYHQTLAVQRFLNFATATPEGYQEQIDIRKAKMRQLLEKNNPNLDMSDDDLSQFIWILSDSSVRQTLKDVTPTSSEELVELIQGAYQESTTDVIKRLFADYQSVKHDLSKSRYTNILTLKEDLKNLKGFDTSGYASTEEIIEALQDLRLSRH